ncbi:MAG TPA: tetratricopeptide repeat protein [Candidatus Acidoferrales bacterium]
MPEGHDRELAFELFRQAYDHQLRGELDEAIELYKRSLEACPTAEAYTFLGWTYSFMSQWDEAIAECRKAIEVDPDFGNPYNDIGAYLIEKGQWDEAVPWLEKACAARRYESHFFPHFNLGRICEHKRQFRQAMDHYKRALELSPQYTLAARALRRLQAMMN